MTLIWGRRCSCRERISEESLPPPDSIHDETPVNRPTVKPPVAKYTEEDLQRILRKVLEARAPSDGACEKPLKARLPDVYYGKSHIKCYNFCQQCKDHFAIAWAKGPNCIPFVAFFLRDRINFRWQQYKRKHEAKRIILIIWKEFKTFLCQSLGDSRAFVNSYWAKIKIDPQYQQKDVLDWAIHLKHLQAIHREFDSVAALNEDTMIRYFWEGPQPSIRA